MKRIHAGFTLVELLVVITIIGILMGLLLPAVNAAREAARNNQCKTQLKNLSLAAIQYENTKGEFPGWVMDFGRFGINGAAPDPGNPDPNAGNIQPHQKIGTWVVALLPYLEAQATFERWNQDKYPILSDDPSELNGYTPAAAPSLAIVQCPSSSVRNGDIGFNNYVSNNGMHPNTTSHPSGPGVDFEASMDRANGVFVNKFAGVTTSGTAPVGPDVSLDDLKDGHGNTALFTENLQAMPWHRAGFIGAADLAVAEGDVMYPVSSRYTQGFVWHWEDPSSELPSGATPPSPSPVHSVNGVPTGGDKFNLEMNNTTATDYARPSSAHSGGVNMAFADGGTRFVGESIDYRVYQALMTPRGKSSDVPFKEFVPTGDEF